MFKFTSYQLPVTSSAGVTLVEIIVVVFIIALFTSIMIADFPNIQRTFYLNRAAHALAQDLRRVQDLSLSGALITNAQGEKIPISGYGVYVNPTADNRTYLLYADSCQPFNFAYNGPGLGTCLDGDYIVGTVDLRDEGSELFIEGFNHLTANYTSVHFTPPNPITTIQNLAEGSQMDIIIGLTSNPSQTRMVTVHTSGLIEVK